MCPAALGGRAMILWLARISGTSCCDRGQNSPSVKPLLVKAMAPDYGTAADYSKPPTPQSSPLSAAAYLGNYHSELFGTIVTDAGLVLKLGPKQQSFALRHFARDVFTYQPVGENAYGPSAVTFMVGQPRLRSLRSPALPGHCRIRGPSRSRGLGSRCSTGDLCRTACRPKSLPMPWTRAGVRLVLKGALQTALCPLSNRSLHRRNGNWKTASRDRRPKPAPHGPKYRKSPTRDWGAPA
jgi:hypothetical protein